MCLWVVYWPDVHLELLLDILFCLNGKLGISISNVSHQNCLRRTILQEYAHKGYLNCSYFSLTHLHRS